MLGLVNFYYRGSKMSDLLSDSFQSNLTEEQKKEAEAEILEKQKIADYDIREYPVGVLVEKYSTGLSDDSNEIFIPDYQREFVWKQAQQSRFIESILLNLPIPYIYVADNYDGENDGRIEVVDGSQRLRTLHAYIGGDLELSKLTTLPTLNGTRFEDLPKGRQLRFLRKTIRIIELQHTIDEEARREMFDRLNTGGTKLTSMETRFGTSSGPFLEFIRELAKNELFRQLCPLSKTKIDHREYEELLLRFFAYLDDYMSFEKEVTPFLGAFLDKMNETSFDTGSLRDEFITVLNFVNKHLPYGFKKSANNQSVPRIRFEAISIGTALALRINSELDVNDCDWLTSKEFGHLTRSDASNSLPKLINRIHFVRDSLLGRKIEYRGDLAEIFKDDRRIESISAQQGLF
jgi:hypothetical protein